MGLLASGQYFRGSDIIRILNHKLEYLAEFASHWLQADCGSPYWCDGYDFDQSTVVDLVDFVMFKPCCFEVIGK